MTGEPIDLTISEARRKKANAMSEERLRYEIARGGKSKFARMMPYLEERLT